MTELKNINLKEGSGVIATLSFRFDYSDVSKKQLDDRLFSVKPKLDLDNIGYDVAKNSLQEIYYQNYLNSAMPYFSQEHRNSQSSKSRGNVQISIIELIDKECALYLSDKLEVEALIKFVDLILYETGIGIFSIKFEPIEQSLASFVSIQKILKNTHPKIRVGGNESELSEFINSLASLPLSSKKPSTKLLFSKVKAINILGVEDPLNEHEKELLLYHVGSGSDFSNEGFSSKFTPSEEYLSELKNNNYLSVFADWKALSLMDSFSIVYDSSVSINWKYDYLWMYNHLVYMKSYVHILSKKLSIKQLSFKDIKRIRNHYVDFINKNQFTEISANFLPNLFHSKMITGLQLGEQLESLDKKIQNIHDLVQDYRSENLNTILTILSLMGFIPAVFAIARSLNEILRLTGRSEEVCAKSEFYAIIILGIIGLAIISYFTVRAFSKKRFNQILSIHD